MYFAYSVYFENDVHEKKFLFRYTQIVVACVSWYEIHTGFAPIAFPVAAW